MCERAAEACAVCNAHADENTWIRYEATIMYPCCLENGADVMDGGLETYYGHWEGIGLPNAANMAYSADKLAWESKKPLSELMAETERGQNEELLKRLRKLPKFGGGHIEVDEIAAKLVEILSRELEKKSPGRRRSLWLGHLAGGENMHIAYGKHMPATTDGRRDGQPLADSMAGSHGDAVSPTAAIKSICRLDHSRLQAGNVSTLNMTPADFAEESGRRNVAALIRAFVAMGGSQLQINVLDTAVLRKAQREPELYAGIIVRVAGYSSAFDGLGKTVQDEIIARYEKYE